MWGSPRPSHSHKLFQGSAQAWQQRCLHLIGSFCWSPPQNLQSQQQLFTEINEPSQGVAVWGSAQLLERRFRSSKACYTLPVTYHASGRALDIASVYLMDSSLMRRGRGVVTHRCHVCLAAVWGAWRHHRPPHPQIHDWQTRPACAATSARSLHVSACTCSLLIMRNLPQARSACRQAAVEGYQFLTPCWTCQIEVRPNQTWAQYWPPPPATDFHNAKQGMPPSGQAIAVNSTQRMRCSSGSRYSSPAQEAAVRPRAFSATQDWMHDWHNARLTWMLYWRPSVLTVLMVPCA